MISTFHEMIISPSSYYLFAEYLNRRLEKPLGPDLAPFVAGALTGVGHCTIEYPFDCVKTRMQVLPGGLAAAGVGGGTGTPTVLAAETYSGILSTIRTDSGLQKNLLKGYGVWISRAVLAHSTCFGLLGQLKPYIFADRS